MAKLALDIGYSAIKAIYNDNLAKIQSSVAYANTGGIDYGDNSIYNFEGEKFVVGKPTETSFVTTDYKFLLKFGPLLAYHTAKKLNIPLDNIEISTGLAISDWNKKQEFIDRFHNTKEINGENVNFIIKNIIPQGAGVYYDYLRIKPDAKNDLVFIIDIGYNTINTLGFENGKPQRQWFAAHVGAGVVTIIKEFTKWMENKYNMSFSEQEALKIFIKQKFTFQGLPQPEVPEQIKTLKRQFVNQLFKSILVSEKKLLATSDHVVIAGGGCYLLKETTFPPNVFFVEDPYEFSNVRGYNLFL